MMLSVYGLWYLFLQLSFPNVQFYRDPAIIRDIIAIIFLTPLYINLVEKATKLPYKIRPHILKKSWKDFIKNYEASLAKIFDNTKYLIYWKRVRRLY